MKKIIDKIITSFFVLVLGGIWYCSTKCQVKPDSYTITIYDVFGKEVKIDEIRTDFKTKSVAYGFMAEYKKRFSQYDFSMALEMPEIKRRLSLKKILGIQR